MYSIIIPAYNEANRIKNVLSSYATKFQDDEVIVVCDGQDSTGKIIENLAKEHSCIVPLIFQRRLGKGGAIKEGFKAANGDMMGFTDADESISPDDFRDMFGALEGVDGVIASRRVAGSRIIVKQPLMRRIGSRGFNLLVRMIFSLHFKDTQCGAKVFRREAIYDIIDDIETKGFEIDVEILWRLKNKGYSVAEYPVTWSHSEESKFKLSYSLAMLISLLKIRLK